MGDPKTYQFDLPSERPAAVTIPEQWYPRVQDYWPRCTSQRVVGDHITGIVAVVVHATAGATSAGAVSVMNPPPGGKISSFHWLVPDEDEAQHGNTIWACVRERDAAWHVLNSKHHPDVNNDERMVNHWSLGIEIVNRQSGGDSFSEWQVAVTAQIIRYCWAKYPNLKHVVSHAKLDPDRRTDPGRNFDWEKFKALVLDTSQEPLDTLPPAFGFGITGEFFGEVQNASLAEEETNAEKEEGDEKLHETGGGLAL